MPKPVPLPMIERMKDRMTLSLYEIMKFLVLNSGSKGHERRWRQRFETQTLTLCPFWWLFDFHFKIRDEWNEGEQMKLRFFSFFSYLWKFEFQTQDSWKRSWDPKGFLSHSLRLFLFLRSETGFIYYFKYEKKNDWSRGLEIKLERTLKELERFRGLVF